MCEHCEVLQKTLVALLGEKPTAVIMRRVTRELHGEPAPPKNEMRMFDSEQEKVRGYGVKASDGFVNSQANRNETR
jgi:hypothetical protein